MEAAETEDLPAEIQYDHCEQPFECFGDFFIERFVSAKLFESIAYAVNHAPYYKCESNAVPKSRQEEDNQNIYYGAAFAFSVSSERNIYIFFEPSSQRNVPTAPKFGY